MLFTLPLIVEIVLTGLLAATLIYCALLERRLSALRKGQDGLKATIGELNKAIIEAGTSMRMLKAATAGAAGDLDDRLSRARGLADELSLLTASGERIADRIDRGVPERPVKASGIHPASLANRLDALKPAARTAMGAIR
ncbi:MAG: hypothetical protein GC166_02805 [Alphaproteobacteria bacterium]|nr:hypothetical protein [Alphaproteobacteria bacterium]